MRWSIALVVALAVGMAGLGFASFAHATPNDCMSGFSTPSGCQFEPVNNSVAPAQSKTLGIKLEAGVSNVFFNNFPGTVPPYFISNSSSSALFVPQNTAEEFQSFITAVSNSQVAYVTAANAVLKTTYTATPGTFSQCTFEQSTTLRDVPANPEAVEPLTRNGYTYLDAQFMMVPSGLTTDVGPVLFTQTRNDCSRDNENNSGCNKAIYTNSRTYRFSAAGTKPNYTWDTTHPAVTADTLTLSVNGVNAGAVANCGTTQAPVLRGTCGANNGTDLVSQPTTGLCSMGDASAVTAYEIPNYGIKWGWTCNDVQGTIPGVQNQPIATGIGCAACQDKAKQDISNCSATCGGGSQTVTWFDGCGNIEIQYSQSCNTQPCCTSHTSTNTGNCSVACGGGYQTVTWFNSCGQAEDNYNQSCNLQSCCTAKHGSDVITSSRGWAPPAGVASTCPLTVRVLAVGGGGTGGSGGVNRGDCGGSGAACGAGGGGAGAGNIATTSLTLTSEDGIYASVAGAGGASAFGPYLYAGPGGNGASGSTSTGGGGGWGGAGGGGGSPACGTWGGTGGNGGTVGSGGGTGTYGAGGCSGGVGGGGGAWLNSGFLSSSTVGGVTFKNASFSAGSPTGSWNGYNGGCCGNAGGGHAYPGGYGYGAGGSGGGGGGQGAGGAGGGAAGGLYINGGGPQAGSGASGSWNVGGSGGYGAQGVVYVEWGD